MTPFERRLAAALRAYANEPALHRSPGAVVAEVRSHRNRRWWLLPGGVAAAVLILAAGIAGIRALDGSAASLARATVDGRTYMISMGEQLAFAPGDLMPAGTVDDTNAAAFFNDRIAYAVRGVDPSTLLIAERPPGEQTSYLLLIGPRADLLDLCPFYEAGSIPSLCVRASPQQEVP